MAESNRPSGTETVSNGFVEPARAPRNAPGGQVEGALRPPDWTGPVSVSALTLERLAQQQAVPRMTGARAEAATLRSQLRQARDRQDFDAERVLGAQLARLLTLRGSELAYATKLARRSLLMGDAPKLREELSLWYAGLGEPVLAAGTLEPLLEREHEPVLRARHWVRIAVLRARAEDPRGTVRALVSAAEADRSDPLPYELLGSLHAWAPDVVPKAKASRAFVEAAQRRSTRGDSRGATENLLQAFEMAPGYEIAAERLARQLSQEGRFQAADEVWRACALASSNPRGLHDRRIREALGAGAPTLALGAALDAEADRSLDEEGVLTAASLAIDGAARVPVPNFDGLLFPLGLGALLAARLEIVCDIQSGPERAASLVRLARLCAGPLGDPPRSARYLSLALREEPALAVSFDELREYSDATGSLTELADAVYQLGLREPISDAVVGYLEKFAALAERHSVELGLAVWALRRCQQQAPLVPQSAELLQRLEERVHHSELPGNVHSLGVVELREFVAALAERPEQVALYADALEEMHLRDPQSKRWQRELVRCFERLARRDELEKLWRQQLEANGEEAEQALLCLLRHHHHQGQPEKALSLLRQAPTPLGPQSAAFGSTLASLYGNASQRAEGLSLLSALVPPEVRAVFYAVAADNSLAAQESTKALSFAELACKADPAAARPVVAYATVASDRHDRVATLALERASEMTVPRAQWCRALANAAAAQGQPGVELVWLRRWVSLAPLDGEACSSLLTALASGADAEQLEKGLSWLLAQPQPMGRVMNEVAGALKRLVFLDPIAAQRQVVRVVGAVGVRDARLLNMLAELAPQLGEPRLMIAVYERQLASADPGDASDILLRLAGLRARIADGGGAADALVRALNCGAAPAPVAEALDALPEIHSSDGRLSVLQCRARCLSLSLSDESTPAAREAAARAHREWGAGLWDLANDQQGAIDTWISAATLDREHGDERLARDLIAFSGYAAGTRILRDLAADREPAAGATLLLVAAAVALRAGSLTEALELAQTALGLQPSRMEALAVIERAATAGQLEVLSAAYQQAAGAVLGRFGERALNYRAARQFERRREPGLAFKHAAAAFVAVPTEGIAFALMLRLASMSGQSAAAAAAIERAAAEAKTPALRLHWLERAARAVGVGVDGQRMHVDVLLRTLSVQIEVEALEALLPALRELCKNEPDARTGLHRRFADSVHGMLKGQDSRSTAPAAVAVGHIAAEVFQDAEMCAASLVLSVGLDPGLSPGAVKPFAETLRPNSQAAHLFVEAVLGAANTGAVIHPETIGLAESLALEVAPRLFARTLLAQVKQTPDDLQLLERAHAAADGDAALLSELERITPWEQEVARVLEGALELQESQPGAAATLLLRLLDDGRLETTHYVRAFEMLRQIYTASGNAVELESLLSRGLESEGLPSAQRLQVARDLSALLSDRAAHSAALDVLIGAEAWGALSLEDYRKAADIAAACADPGRELEALTRLLAVSAGDDRVAALRRIAALQQKLGQQRSAAESYRQILFLVPDDEVARGFILDDTEQAEDWPALARLLEEEVRRTPAIDAYLRLADVLENRLNDPSGSIDSLETGLVSLGDQPALLEAMALVHQRRNHLPGAAEAYRRASRATREPAQSAQFAELACQLYLDGGDVDSAQMLLSVKGVYPHSESLSCLRVELARRRGAKRDLAAALEELALVSMADPAERAGFLREAAELSLAMGESQLALARAQRASRIAPTDPEVRLFTSMLEYRERGVGTPDEALRTISELRAIRGLTDPDLAELRAFLLAEALDCRVGTGAALAELREAEQLYGPLPLVALGLADRLGAKGQHDEAVRLYGHALAGDLRGLKDAAEVALCSARHAQQTGDPVGGSALGSGTEAPGDGAVDDPQMEDAVQGTPEVPSPLEPSTPAEKAQEATKEASASQSLRELAPPKPSSADLRPGEHAAVSTSAATHGPVWESARPAVRALSSSEIAIPSEPPGRPTPEPLATTAEPLGATKLDSAAESSSVEGSREISGGSESVDVCEQPQGDETISEDGVAALALRRFRGTLTTSSNPPARDAGGFIESAFSRSFSIESSSEDELLRELRGGSVDSGLALCEMLSKESGRIHDLVNVHRVLVALRPGDLGLTAGLLSAVERDNDQVFALAIRHALHVFHEPESAPVAPQLSRLPEQGESLLRLLNPTPAPALEAIGLVWRNAPHLFRRLPIDLTGYRSVQTTSRAPLDQVCCTASRLLEATRTEIRHRPGSSSVGFKVHLQSPIVLEINGDGEPDAPAFRYHLGAMLLATTPEYALTYGLSGEELGVLCGALLAAFGPPRRLSGDVAGIAHLAERLWEGLSARVQRRLQELCQDPEDISYEKALEGTNRALRRAGLFLAADLEVAVRQVCIEEGEDLEEHLANPDGLRALCDRNEHVADLIRFATCTEYAEVRWHSKISGSSRSSSS